MTFEEQLIAEVRKNPCLYDKDSSKYKDKEYRKRTWMVLAERLKRPDDICRKRWKSLRDKFIHCLVREEENQHISWPYFQHMEFIRYHTTSKRLGEETVNRAHTPKVKSEHQKICEVLVEDRKMALWSEEEELTQMPEQEETINSFYDDENNTLQNKRRKLDSNTDNISNVLEKFNDFLDKKIQNEKNIYSNRNNQENDAFLKLIGGYLTKMDSDNLEDFKMDILNFVHNKYKEYKIL